MPNWCSNYFKVEGHPRRVVEFIMENFRVCDYESWESFLNKPGIYTFTLEGLIPTPKGQTGEIIDDWYSWRLSHWGTKWDVGMFAQHFTCKLKSGETIVVKDDKFNSKFFKDTIDSMDVNTPAVLEMAFNSAWTYPLEWYQRLFTVHEGDDLKFFYDYYEGGCGFAGEMLVQNKNVLDEFHVECNDPVRYYKYLLDKGHEDPDYILSEIYEIYRGDYGHLGVEFVDKIYNSTEKAIMELKDNRNEGLARVFTSLLGINK